MYGFVRLLVWLTQAVIIPAGDDRERRDIGPPGPGSGDGHQVRRVTRMNTASRAEATTPTPIGMHGRIDIGSAAVAARSSFFRVR
jgi:hypothetical protein